MSFDEELARRASRVDVRLRGFGDLVAYEEALEWIARHGGLLDAEEIATAQAAGHVLAGPVDAPSDLPPFDRVSEDGYAVSSGETIGAGTYNPLLLELQQAPASPRPRGAVLVAAGSPLPPGADAVVPFGDAQSSGTSLEVLGSVAEGVGIERRGAELRAGAALAPGGRALRPQDAAALSALGVDSVRVVRRPRVKLVVASPKGDTHRRDANGPMLRALVERDGGALVSSNSGTGDHRAAILEAAAAPGADLLLASGRTGTGPDDDAPLALAGAGRLSIHGVAVRPGGSAAMGHLGMLPVILLPGDPLACLGAYELFAGAMIRRMGGRDPRLPHPALEAEVARKIVSTIGFTELCQVRLAGGGVEPTASAGAGGIASAVRADGFVLVPASLEGYAPGARVLVHIYQ